MVEQFNIDMSRPLFLYLAITLSFRLIMKILLSLLLFISVTSHATDFYKVPNVQNVSLKAMIKDSDSSVLIVGYVGTPISRGIIVRTDLSGDTIWSRSFEDSLAVRFMSVALSFDSSRIIIVGNIKDSINHHSGLIINLDRAGNIQWQKKYSNNLLSYGFDDISFISNSTFAVTTDQDVDPAGLVIMFDSAGQSLRAYGGCLKCDFAAPILLSDGNLFISGSEEDLMLINTSMNFGEKIDTSLTVIYWANRYSRFTNNAYGNAGKKGLALADGGFIFSNASITEFSMSCTTYRVDSSGHVLWSIDGGPYIGNFLNGDYIFSNNNYYGGAAGFIRMDQIALGYINYSSSDGIDCAGLVTDNGSILGISSGSFFRFDSVSCNMFNLNVISDSAYNFPVDPISATGFGFFNFNSFSTHLFSSPGINFYQDCSINEVKENTKKLINVFPNPAEGKIKIELDKNIFSIATIRVTDVMGRICVDEKLSLPENGLLEFDMSDFPKGIYFIEISAAQYSATSKLVLE